MSAFRLRRRGRVLALAGVLAAAALVRLLRLDLMEFKGDEAEAVRLALHVLGESEPGVGSFFPTAGLVASVGLPNPPLFVYLVALPLALVRSALAPAVFVALANVAAVGLCYAAGRRLFSPFSGLAAAALFALSPWAVVYSRKIWAQNLLPLFTGLILLALHAFLVEKRPRAAAALVLVAGAATQVHFSAWVLVAVVAAALLLGRDALEWKWLGLGAAGVVLLYLPYLWHLVAVAEPELGEEGEAPGLFGRLRDSVRNTLAITGGDGMERLLGSQAGLVLPLSVVLGSAGILGIAAAARRSRARLLLLVWLVLPAAALTVLPVTSYHHYFIVLLPLPFLGVAHLLEQLDRRSPPAAALALVAALAAFAVVDSRFLGSIAEDGGARGDYGVAYRYKADAAERFVRENPGRDFRVATEGDKEPRDYRVLAWIERPAGDRAARPAVRGYLVGGTLDGLPEEHEPTGLPRTELGPLELVAVPLEACANPGPELAWACERLSG